jgi:hypothetical protein
MQGNPARFHWYAGSAEPMAAGERTVSQCTTCNIPRAKGWSGYGNLHPGFKREDNLTEHAILETNRPRDRQILNCAKPEIVTPPGWGPVRG